MYKIGELSKLTGISVKTLRFYDSEGLLVPDRTDNFTGYRYYSASRIIDCYRILALKELGFSLKDIKNQISSDKKDSNINLIEDKIRELNEALTRINLQIHRLGVLKNQISGGNSMYNAIIKNSGELKIAAVRKILNDKSEAFKEIEKIKNLLPHGAVGKRTVIVNHETQSKDTCLDMTVGVELTGTLPKNAEISEKTLDYGRCASVTCKNESIDEAYSAMANELSAMNAQITGSFSEIYYEDGTVEINVPVCLLSDKNTQITDTLGDFENDENAIGKWNLIDIVLDEEQFVYGHKKTDLIDIAWIKELYFLPNGEGWWIIDGWTKGAFISSVNYPKYTARNEYKITEQNGKTLMFVNMYDEYETFVRGGKPRIYVFEKEDSREYTKYEIGTHDNIDIPFEEDERILGHWEAVDLVRDEARFDPKNSFFKGELYFSAFTAESDGNVIVIYGGKEIKRTYTKDFFIDKTRRIAEKYTLKTINGREYLFIEWKSGDYIYGKRRPWLYVFTRKLNE